MRALPSIRHSATSPFAWKLSFNRITLLSKEESSSIRLCKKALVQTRIDADVKEQATIVLENMGLTISDAVRILLTRTAKEAALPMELLD